MSDSPEVAVAVAAPIPVTAVAPPVAAPIVANKNAVAEHIFTLPILLCLIGIFSGIAAASHFFPAGSPWQLFLAGIAATFGLGSTFAGLLWQSLHVRSTMAAAAPTPAELSAIHAARLVRPPGASGIIMEDGTVKSDIATVAVVVLIMFGSLGALLMPSCNTLSGKAATAAGKACESLMLPAEEQAAEAQVVAILADPITWEADLLSLGLVIGRDQVTCLVRTVMAGVGALLHPPTDGGVLRASSMARSNYAPNTVIANGNAWLAKYGGGAK